MSNVAFVLIEGGLVFGSVLAFVCWQWRDLKRERQRALEKANAIARKNTSNHD